MNKATNRRKTAAEPKKQQHQVFTPTQTTNMNESSVFDPPPLTDLACCKTPAPFTVFAQQDKTDWVSSGQKRKYRLGAAG
jgi:hypothetical protein